MEFNLYKVMAIATIVILTIALLGTIDFSEASSGVDVLASLDKPLHLKNWHYALVIFIIWTKKL